MKIVKKIKSENQKKLKKQQLVNGFNPYHQWLSRTKEIKK